MKAFWILIVFLSGVFLPIQAGMNQRLGKSIESPVYASMISFIVGAVAVFIYILITQQTLAWEGFKTAPAYTYIAGALGGFYVTVIVLAFPILGPALSFGLVIAGQMIVSMIMDHFSIFAEQAHPFNWGRLAGVVLLILGVVLIKKY